MSNDRTTALGLARYAREYYDAALAADDVIGNREGYEIFAPPPVMFLVAHSIELALKAFLLSTGMPVSELRNVGHNLSHCWDVSLKNGVNDHVCLTEENISILGVISNLHVSTELRYIQTGYKEFPVFGPLQDLAKKILDGICPLVGYK